MEDVGMGSSEISEWYQNKTIFITGGTGFLGKVLVEKLLRSCNVKRIYLLMRPKKGVDISQRLDDMIKLNMFDRIRIEQPEMLQKIVPIGGDIAMEGLGITEENEVRLAKEVNVLFHAAATINFQEPLKVAVNINMLGTKRVVALAHKMSNIKALVYVSTAYSNCHLSETNEKLYSAPADPKHIIQLTQWLDDEMLEWITPKLIAPRPNTYTYTKALAEHILVNDSGTIPYSIVRPSIVGGSWREPMPGWIDNMNGYTGFVMGMGTGIIRSSFIKSGITVDLIPVDIVTNTLIASAWNTDVKKFKIDGGKIYCCSSSSQNPVTGDEVCEFSKYVIHNYPMNSVLWFPSIYSAKYNEFALRFPILFINIIPAFVTDLILKLLGINPFAVRQCKRMLTAIRSLEYFGIHSWTFHNTNVRKLYEVLCLVDKNIFNFDISQLDWKKYYQIYHLGVKQYILKESVNCKRGRSRPILLGGFSNSRDGTRSKCKSTIKVQERTPCKQETV